MVPLDVSSDSPKKSDDDLQWDDVKREWKISQSRKPPLETREVSAATFKKFRSQNCLNPTGFRLLLDIPLFLTVEWDVTEC